VNLYTTKTKLAATIAGIETSNEKGHCTKDKHDPHADETDENHSSSHRMLAAAGPIHDHLC
jgi:hypothetical protein